MSTHSMSRDRNAVAALPASLTFTRREFGQLHVKDQAIKTSKKLCIEANWGHSLQECLPPAIRPRCELKKGSKARTDEGDVPEEAWWNWSVELIKCLEELSALTKNRVDIAGQLLLIEVQARQENPKSPQRKIVELVLGDAQRVVDGISNSVSLVAAGKVEQDTGFDDMMDHKGAGDGDYFGDANGMSTYHDDDMQIPMSPSYDATPILAARGAGGRTLAAANTNQYNSPTQAASYLSAETQLRVTELRAKAARLKAKAGRLEVEAAEAEAEELGGEAEELRRQQMEGFE